MAARLGMLKTTEPLLIEGNATLASVRWNPSCPAERRLADSGHIAGMSNNGDRCRRPTRKHEQWRSCRQADVGERQGRRSPHMQADEPVAGLSHVRLLPNGPIYSHSNFQALRSLAVPQEAFSKGMPLPPTSAATSPCTALLSRLQTCCHLAGLFNVLVGRAPEEKAAWNTPDSYRHP